MSIYLDNLSYEVTKEDLDAVFRKYKLMKPTYITSKWGARRFFNHRDNRF